MACRIIKWTSNIYLKNGSVYTIDVRSYPGRNPEEPDNEKVVRGSRDGFTENIVQNTALIRRRIRDTRFAV